MAKRAVPKNSPDIAKRRSWPRVKRPRSVPAPPEKPSAEQLVREDAAIAAFTEKRKSRLPSPSLRFEKNKAGGVIIGHSHADLTKGGKLLSNALGGCDHDFITGLLNQIVNATRKGADCKEEAANFVLSAIKAVQPQDEVETMLASQMAVTQIAVMNFAQRLNHVDNIPQQDSASNAFNKLARTFATQVEALKRYRTGGEQRVTVQHVNVSDGGQAIVGDVLANPRRREGEG